MMTETDLDKEEAAMETTCTPGTDPRRSASAPGIAHATIQPDEAAVHQLAEWCARIEVRRRAMQRVGKGQEYPATQVA
jgi:hypothetical protein